MAETSRFWDGLATGDATVAPYNAATEFAQVLLSLSRPQSVNKGGVVRGATNDAGTALGNLAVTGTSSPVSLLSGRAFVYGSWYENSSGSSVTVATPATSTRIDRIVLRKSWSAQTIRYALVAGVEGGSAPALVQTAGTTWEIPIAQVSITTGGVITVTDEREFLGSGVIYKSTLIATAASFDIQSIPAYYEDLELIIRARSNKATTAPDAVRVRFNNDSTNIYDYIQEGWSSTGGAIDGGPPVQSAANIQVPFAAPANMTANVFGYIKIRIPFYAKTDAFKGLLAEGGVTNTSAAASYAVAQTHGQWRSTAAINRITIIPDPAATLFAIGSSVLLRGIPA